MTRSLFRRQARNLFLGSLLGALPLALTAQEPANSAALTLRALPAEDLRGDGWSLLPRITIQAPATFRVQGVVVPAGELAEQFRAYALLCPVKRRFLLVRLDDDVPGSTVVRFLQALREANERLAEGQGPGLPLTAIIPIDPMTHRPVFPDAPPGRVAEPALILDRIRAEQPTSNGRRP